MDMDVDTRGEVCHTTTIQPTTNQPTTNQQTTTTDTEPLALQEDDETFPQQASKTIMLDSLTYKGNCSSPEEAKERYKNETAELTRFLQELHAKANGKKNGGVVDPRAAAMILAVWYSQSVSTRVYQSLS
jgi:hypothetical protein